MTASRLAFLWLATEDHGRREGSHCGAVSRWVAGRVWETGSHDRGGGWELKNGVEGERFYVPTLVVPVPLTYLSLPYFTLPYLTLPYLTLPYLTLPYIKYTL